MLHHYFCKEAKMLLRVEFALLLCVGLILLFSFLQEWRVDVIHACDYYILPFRYYLISVAIACGNFLVTDLLVMEKEKRAK